MDEASEQNPGTMTCVLGLEPEAVEDICQKAGSEIANLNCPGQIVISGTKDSIAKTNELSKEAGAKRVIPLEVSGPFHCSLMSSAADKLKDEIENVEIRKPEVQFIPNVTAEFTDDPDKIKELLIKQVAHTTRWKDSMLQLQAQGISDYCEIGPGKVLRGLLMRIDRGLRVTNIEKDSDFSALVEGNL